MRGLSETCATGVANSTESSLSLGDELLMADAKAVPLPQVLLDRVARGAGHGMYPFGACTLTVQTLAQRVTLPWRPIKI